MNGKVLTLAAAAVLATGLVWRLQQHPGGPAASATGGDGAAMLTISLPADLSAEAQIGKRGFDRICATCHGENATGRQGLGPPLVHKIYRPGHHADFAFQRAVQNGVRSHHWGFGDMPPVAGLTRADVASIVTYVRELQRENGID